MMTKTEVAKLLVIAAGFDNRRLDDVQTAAWIELLGGYSFGACRAAILDHYRDEKTRHQYLTAAHVLDRVEQSERSKSTDVETDVRSAKARGIIPQDWPRREPLTPEAAFKLQAARDADRAEAIRLSAGELEGTKP